MQQDWARVVADLGPRLFRYFRVRFDNEEASDLTQETLLRLVRKHRNGEFDPQRGNLAMYAFGIAYFVRLEAVKARPEPTIGVELADQDDAAPGVGSEHSSSDTLERDIFAKQTAQTLRRAIAQLPAEQAEILSLLIDDEVSLNDIAVLTGLPVGTIKSHVFRAKESSV